VASEGGHREKKYCRQLQKVVTWRWSGYFQSTTQTPKLDIIQLCCGRFQKVAIWRWFGCCSNICLRQRWRDETALTAASESGHIDVALLLLEWDADVNAWCNSGTVLQMASEDSPLDIVWLLLERNADVNTGYTE
jgi:hypothetical protein